MANEQRNMKRIVAVVERGRGRDKKNWWTNIGVAFENRDGSWNLRFDYFPTHMETTTVQLRDFDKDDAADEPGLEAQA